MLHKVEKALMLETDVPETINEALQSVRKMGRIGLISAYAATANHVNVGALMEKGVRLIGNGQGESAWSAVVVSRPAELNRLLDSPRSRKMSDMCLVRRG